MWYRDIIYKNSFISNTESIDITDTDIDSNLSGLYQELNVYMEQYDAILGQNRALKDIERYYAKNKADPVAFTIAKEAYAFYGYNMDTNGYVVHSEGVLNTAKDVVIKIWEKIKEIFSKIANFISKLFSRNKSANENLERVNAKLKSDTRSMEEKNEILRRNIINYGIETEKTIDSINSLRNTINSRGRK